MNNKEQDRRSQSDAELEREIREGRKFTLEEAIGRMVGPGGMKGESPVARKRQAEIEIGTWLGNNLADSGGALRVVLGRRLKGSELLLKNFERPLDVLTDFLREALGNDYTLTEIVREADVEWGRIMGERPLFEKACAPAHPDDPYTVESVRNTLSQLVQQLSTE